MTLLMSQLWDVLGGKNQDAMDKVAGITQDFLRSRLREVSVADRVLPPIPLTEAEIERNTSNNWPLKRVDVEPESKAFAIGFRGKGEARFFEGTRYEVFFSKLESEHFKKTKEELMTMRYPVVDVVENNMVLDMQEQLDGLFRLRLDAAAAASGNVISSSSTTLIKEDIISGKQLITQKRRRPVRMICTESRFQDLARLAPDKLGFDAVERLAFQGTAPEKVFQGMEVVTSINSSAAGSVWDEKTIYLITEPQFLGSSFSLDNVEQEMKREGNMLEWYSWTSRGIEIGNIYSVCKITLT